MSFMKVEVSMFQNKCWLLGMNVDFRRDFGQFLGSGKIKIN